MQRLAIAALSLALWPTGASAQTNAGEQQPEQSLPFTMTQVATFNLPWRIAFLPDGRMLITEKVGPIWLVTQEGVKTPVTNVPAVLSQGQGGMLGVFLSPHYATDHNIYLTYSEPGEALPRDRAVIRASAMARAKLSIGQDSASLDGLRSALARDAQGPWRTVRRGRSPSRPTVSISSWRWATGSA